MMERIAESEGVCGICGVVCDVGVSVVGLEVADESAEGVGGEEAAEVGGVVAGEGVVQAGFWVALVAGEFVVGRAGGGLQPSGVRDFLAIRSEIGVVAKLAGGLTGPAAGCDGARGAELVSKVVKDVTVAVAGSDAAASKEDVFILRGDGAVGFGEGVARNGAPVEFDEGPAAAIVGGARFLGDAEAEAIINVTIRATGWSSGQREAVFGIEGIQPARAAAVLGHVPWGVICVCRVRIDVVVGVHGDAQRA